jgi:hypothetical protein
MRKKGFRPSLIFASKVKKHNRRVEAMLGALLLKIQALYFYILSSDRLSIIKKGLEILTSAASVIKPFSVTDVTTQLATVCVSLAYFHLSLIFAG